ncbi:MAG: hypothetical protein K2K84_02850 [Muribaculaceae bacterium]|nr:hypothetical protein [Muribaculaceae bacterium]
MNFEIKFVPSFLKSLKHLAKKYPSIKHDLTEFAESLRQNPFQGAEIAPGIRKIRMAITAKGRGKSGGARVITFTVMTNEMGEVYMLDIYDKSEYTAVDVSVIKDIIERLELDV